MNIVGIDMGKDKSYVVVESDDTVIREGYVETTKEGITGSLLGVDNPTIILESCSVLDYAMTVLDGYNVVAAHPSQVHMITHSNKKTDRNDAHELINLYKCGHLPTSYIPSRQVKELRDICRSRRFLGSKRTSAMNKIRDLAFRNGKRFEKFNKRTMKELCTSSPLLSVLVDELNGVHSEINALERMMAEKLQGNAYARHLKSIPGIGVYSALSIATEIADVSRFSNEEKIWAYAGLVPKVFQTGNYERRGHLIKSCDDFIKYLLIECISIHVKRCGKCFVCRNYRNIQYEKGTKTARIAAARKLLRVMYYMLKYDQDFWSYMRGREMRQWNSTAMRSSLDCAPLPNRSK